LAHHLDQRLEQLARLAEASDGDRAVAPESLAAKARELAFISPVQGGEHLRVDATLLGTSALGLSFFVVAFGQRNFPRQAVSLTNHSAVGEAILWPMPPMAPPPSGPKFDDEPDIDVDFDTWALLSAQMLRRSIADRVRFISEAGFDETWKAIDERWSTVLLNDLRAGQLDRIERYRAVCMQQQQLRLKRVGRAPSPLDRIVPPERRGVPLPGTHPNETPPFARELVPESIHPDPPSPSQDETAKEVSLDEAGLAAAEEALSWPVEKYAWLCAELLHAPGRAKQLWAVHGLVSSSVRRAVTNRWNRRLDDDPELKSEHAELVQRYVDALRGD